MLVFAPLLSNIETGKELQRFHGVWSISNAVCAPVPKEAHDAARAREIERLQGDWVLVETILPSGIVHKHKEGEPGADHFNVYIKKSWAIFHFDGTDPDDEIVERFTLNPAKTPKQIDFTGVSSTITGYKKGGKELGIYKLEGDTLTLTIGWTGKSAVPRPTVFKPKDEGVRSFKFVRSKKSISEDSTGVSQRPPLVP